MYTVLVILTLIKNPSIVMQYKSPPYSTLELCEQNVKTVLQFRDKDGIVDGMKVKDAYCVKEK